MLPTPSFLVLPPSPGAAGTPPKPVPPPQVTRDAKAEAAFKEHAALPLPDEFAALARRALNDTHMAAAPSLEDRARVEGVVQAYAAVWKALGNRIEERRQIARERVLEPVAPSRPPRPPKPPRLPKQPS